MSTPTPAPVEKEEIIEHEILVTILDYSASEPCTPTFKLAATPDLENGMAFSVIINGGAPLKPAKVTATDLRAGAAMVSAGLLAEGKTIIRNAAKEVEIINVKLDEDKIKELLNS